MQATYKLDNDHTCHPVGLADGRHMCPGQCPAPKSLVHGGSLLNLAGFSICISILLLMPTERGLGKGQLLRSSCDQEIYSEDKNISKKLVDSKVIHCLIQAGGILLGDTKRGQSGGSGIK